MNISRFRNAVNVFTYFTGVIFLNMSFMFAEVSALKAEASSEMTRGLWMLMANSMAEEEPGAADEDSTLSGLDLIVNHHHVVAIDIISNNKFGALSHGQPRQGEFDVFYPPPQA